MVSLKIRPNAMTVLTMPVAIVAALVISTTPVAAQLISGSADLDQARNGGPSNPVSPINWVNGSLNATQAHYREAYSVPYRIYMQGLSTGAGNPHSLVIEWDITKGGKHALDFITHYNRLEPHQVAFGHPAEEIDPLAGLSGTFVLTPPDPGMADVIPAPTSTNSPVPGQPTTDFNALPLNERRITIYNGTITGLSYVSEANPNVSDGSTSLRIDFIANDPKVVVLWGGHIASSLTWGQGNSAAQINGSSYHTRTISLDGASVGNQDRSLSAQAVVIIPPPPCGITGLDAVCPGSTNTYTAPNVANATYAWTITSACGATFVGGGTAATTQSVNVVACPTCGSYTLHLTITANGQNTNCTIDVAVVDSVAPMISGSIPAGNLDCNSALPAPAANITQLLALITGGTITDNCTATAQLIVSSSDGGLNGSSCSGTRVRTYTVTDICGNSSTITQTFNIHDSTPPTITGTIPAANLECSAVLPAPATTINGLLNLISGGSISDNCTANNALTVSSSDGPLNGSSCSGTRVRTYTVADACGNSSTITQTFNIHDSTAPSIIGTIAASNLECNASLPAPATTLAQLLALMNGGATITDNCTSTNALVVTSSDGAPTGTSCSGMRVRTYSVADACGNTSTITQTFNIHDTTGPVIVGTIPDATRECSAGLPAPATTVAQLLALMNAGGTISDNCSAQGSLVVSNIDSPLSGTNCTGVRVRTYFVSDLCGNLSGPITQTFHIQDTTPPVINGAIPPVSVECNGTGLPPAATTVAQLLALMGQGATISDNCTSNPNLVVTHQDGSVEGTGCSGKLIRTYTVSDSCGNPAHVEQSFSFSDEVAPVITCPSEAHVECGNAMPAKAMNLAEFQAQGGNASDNCALASVQWVSDEQISPGTECPVTYLRTYRATDACDNSAECTQLIILEDHTPPILCCCVTEVFGCLGYPVVLDKPIVTDECGMTIIPEGTRSDKEPLDAPFPLGVTTVTWTAHDGCGNKAEPITVTVTIDECPSYSTKMQGEWAQLSDPQTDGVSLVQTLLLPANGGNMPIGRMSSPGPRSLTIRPDNVSCLAQRLPTSGTPVAFPNNYGNKVLSASTCNTTPALPTWPAGKFKNSLLGQEIALVFNIRYNRLLGSGQFVNLPLCPVMTTIDGNGVVKSYVIPAAVLNKLGVNATVGGLRDLGHDALAGRPISPATLASINTAITRVNQMFNGGNVALLNNSCVGLPMTLAGGHTPEQGAIIAGAIGGTAGSKHTGASNGKAENSTADSIAPNHVNDGTIAPAQTEGQAFFEGDFTQTQAGTLIMQLRGTEPVTGYDVVSVTGKASLHGTLAIQLADGYMPKTGDQFEILNADAVIGVFDTLNLATLDGRKYLDVDYGPQSVTIEVKERPQVVGDLDDNDTVNSHDLLTLIQSWGKPNSSADLNHDGTVDAADLTLLLSNWGSH